MMVGFDNWGGASKHCPGLCNNCGVSELVAAREVVWAIMGLSQEV